MKLKDTITFATTFLVLLGGAIAFPVPVLSQERLVPEPNPDWVVPLSVHFLSSGPVNPSGDGRWRLSITASEIYRGLCFEKLELQQEFEGAPRLAAAYCFSGFEIAEAAGVSDRAFFDLELVAWEEWNHLLLQEGGHYFHIQINEDNSFTIL